jgi:hypothetical protein
MSSATFMNIEKTGYDTGYIQRAYWLASALLELANLGVIIGAWASTEDQHTIREACPSAGSLLVFVSVSGFVRALVITFLLRSRLKGIFVSSQTELDRNFSVKKIVLIMFLHVALILFVVSFLGGLDNSCDIGRMNRVMANMLGWGSFANLLAYLAVFWVSRYGRQLRLIGITVHRPS